MYEIVAVVCLFFFFQAEDGIRDLVRSRGLGDVYKRQVQPDFLLIRRERASIIAGDGRIRGVPDLIAEVLSLSLIHI